MGFCGNQSSKAINTSRHWSLSSERIVTSKLSRHHMIPCLWWCVEYEYRKRVDQIAMIAMGWVPTNMEDLLLAIHTACCVFPSKPNEAM